LKVLGFLLSIIFLLEKISAPVIWPNSLINFLLSPIPQTHKTIFSKFKFSKLTLAFLNSLKSNFLLPKNIASLLPWAIKWISFISSPYSLLLLITLWINWKGFEYFSIAYKFFTKIPFDRVFKSLNVLSKKTAKFNYHIFIFLISKSKSDKFAE